MEYCHDIGLESCELNESIKIILVVVLTFLTTHNVVIKYVHVCDFIIHSIHESAYSGQILNIPKLNIGLTPGKINS